MASYFFDQMTQAQADTFLHANDVIVFTSGSANQATVIFNPLTVNTPPSITLTVGANSLNFGDGNAVIRGQSLTLFPDGSKLYIGLATADTVTGTAAADGLFGGDGDDTMDGAGGNDLRNPDYPGRYCCGDWGCGWCTAFGARDAYDSGDPYRARPKSANQLYQQKEGVRREERLICDPCG